MNRSASALLLAALLAPAASATVVYSPQGPGWDAVLVAEGIRAPGVDWQDYGWSVGAGPALQYEHWDRSFGWRVENAAGQPEGTAKFDLWTAGDLRPEGFWMFLAAHASSTGLGEVDNYSHIIGITLETDQPLPYTVIVGSGSAFNAQGLRVARYTWNAQHLPVRDRDIFSLAEADGTSVVTGVLSPGLYRVESLEWHRDLADTPWVWMQFGLVPEPSAAALLAAGVLSMLAHRRRAA